MLSSTRFQLCYCSSIYIPFNGIWHFQLAFNCARSLLSPVQSNVYYLDTFIFLLSAESSQSRLYQTIRINKFKMMPKCKRKDTECEWNKKKKEIVTEQKIVLNKGVIKLWSEISEGVQCYHTMTFDIFVIFFKDQQISI